MASIDGGFYFLTVLVPVRREWAGGVRSDKAAPIIELRKKLAQMPTAMQTPASRDTGKISAFSKSTRTHFARFAVIDRLGYNGYQAVDPVLSTLGLIKAEQTREELQRPYLLFAAEFDAPSGSPNYDLAAYLRELWDVMRDDMVGIFENCVDFDPAEITTAAQFISYIKGCELETTMPFNYYWMENPVLPTLTAKGLGFGAAAIAIVLGIGTWWLLAGWIGWPAILAGIVVGIAAAIIFVGQRLKALGDARFPAPPDADLLSVLKALHLQTTFGHFVTQQQSKDSADLYAAFGDYLDYNKPQEAEPRHPAGKVLS